MPIYEYRCDSCGFQKEYLQRMSEPRLTDCPECKKATFNKMVTAAGFQLKGGGWYVTDFKSGGSNTNAAVANKKPVENQSDSSGKAESSGGVDKSKSESAAPASASSTSASAATAPASSPTSAASSST